MRGRAWCVRWGVSGREGRSPVGQRCSRLYRCPLRPLPVRRRFQRGGRGWLLPLPGLGCPSSRKLEMLGVSSASAWCVLITHRAGQAVSWERALRWPLLSHRSRSVLSLVGQGLSRSECGGNSLEAGWERGSTGLQGQRGPRQGMCRCLQLACGWCQARTLQLSPIG